VTIADVLKAELEAAAADLDRGCDRAADAAEAYIVRRLQQLERHFPRHRFVFNHGLYADCLQVYPAIRGHNHVKTILRVMCSRSTRWTTMRKLFRVERQLQALAHRIAGDFDRLLGRLDVGGQTTRRMLPSKGVMAQREYDELGDKLDRADAQQYNRRISRRMAYAL